MKNLFCLIILLSSLSIAAQEEYIPLVEENKHYLYYACSFEPDTPLPGYFPTFYEYLLRGDTLINDEIYKKWWMRVLDVPDDYDSCADVPAGEVLTRPFSVASELYLGALRDDIEERKVYFFPAEDYNLENANCYPEQQEYVFFDFSRVEGDTIEDCWENGNVVTLVHNGVEQFFYQGLQTRLHAFGIIGYIEGIGHALGLERRLNEIIPGWTLILTEICTGTDEVCLFAPSRVSNLLPSEAVRVVPSPSSGQFTLQSEHAFNNRTTLHIMDATGKVLHEQRANGGAISVSVDLPAGLYFLHVTDGAQPVWVGKTVLR